jgi:hypothetical protein
MLGRLKLDILKVRLQGLYETPLDQRQRTAARLHQRIVTGNRSYQLMAVVLAVSSDSLLLPGISSIGTNCKSSESVRFRVDIFLWMVLYEKKTHGLRHAFSL